LEAAADNNSLRDNMKDMKSKVGRINFVFLSHIECLFIYATVDLKESLTVEDLIG